MRPSVRRSSHAGCVLCAEDDAQKPRVYPCRSVDSALGIGGNTAVFSVVHALLLRSLPLPDPDRLMFLTGSNPARPGAGVPFSLTAYETVREGNRSLSGVTAFCAEGLTLTGMGDPAQLTASRVSPNFFEVLHVQPMLGRGFQASEGEAGGKPVVLISQRLWQSRFAGDPAVLGRVVTLSQDEYTIIGVMPAEFPFPFTGTDVWATRLMRYSGLQAEQIRNGAGYLAAIAPTQAGSDGQSGRCGGPAVRSGIPPGSSGQSGCRPARPSRVDAATATH